jgi:hypothetical protein
LFEGTTSTLSVDDRIVDVSTSDNDVFNLTATADPVAMDITNVENINIFWDAFGTPDIDLDNVIGATVTLSSEKSGYLGNANFTNVDRNNVTLGDGIVGTVTVDGTVDSTINAGNAKTLTITGADRDLTVNADNTQTVTIAAANDADTLTLSALAATAITVDANREATVTVGADADLTITGTAEYTFNSDADVQLDVAANAVFDSITLGGSGAITLNFAQAADLEGQTIVNGGAIIIEDEIAATNDFTKVSHSTITLEDDLVTLAAAAAMTLATGAHVVLEVDMDEDTTFETSAADDATSGDELTLTLKSDQTEALITEGGAGDFELVNITVDADAVANAADITIADIQAGTEKVIFTSATNDFTVTTMDASEVDASAVQADFNMTQTSDAEMLVIGGSADNTVVFDGEDNDSTFIGGEGDDAITLVTEGGEAAMIVNGGDNTVTANALDDGQLTVLAGDGDDTVSATALTSGIVSLELGDGDNDVTIGGVLAGATISITTGNGKDTVAIADDTSADEEITLVLGTGTDTLDVSDGADLTLGTWSVSGLDVIAVGAGTTTADSVATDPTPNGGVGAQVNADLLTGQSYKITGQGDVDEYLTVNIDSAGTYDFSGLEIDNTIGKAIGGLDIIGSAGADVITGTTGQDIFFGQGGADTFVFASGDSTKVEATADVITDFVSGTDKLKLGVAGTANNFSSLDGDDDANTPTVFADALIAADNALDKTVQYVFVSDGATDDQGWLFIDFDLDGTSDSAITLTGLADGDVLHTDIIA